MVADHNRRGVVPVGGVVVPVAVGVFGGGPGGTVHGDPCRRNGDAHRPPAATVGTAGSCRQWIRLVRRHGTVVASRSAIADGGSGLTGQAPIGRHPVRDERLRHGRSMVRRIARHGRARTAGAATSRRAVRRGVGPATGAEGETVPVRRREMTLPSCDEDVEGCRRGTPSATRRPWSGVAGRGTGSRSCRRRRGRGPSRWR